MSVPEVIGKSTIMSIQAEYQSKRGPCNGQDPGQIQGGEREVWLSVPREVRSPVRRTRSEELTVSVM